MKAQVETYNQGQYYSLKIGDKKMYFDSSGTPLEDFGIIRSLVKDFLVVTCARFCDFSPPTPTCPPDSLLALDSSCLLSLDGDFLLSL
jgi:hypothetical protein